MHFYTQTTNFSKLMGGKECVCEITAEFSALSV